MYLYTRVHHLFIYLSNHFIMQMSVDVFAMAVFLCLFVNVCWCVLGLVAFCLCLYGHVFCCYIQGSVYVKLVMQLFHEYLRTKGL